MTPTQTTQPVLSAAQKLHLALQAARSTSIPESAFAIWAKRGVR